MPRCQWGGGGWVEGGRRRGSAQRSRLSRYRDVLASVPRTLQPWLELGQPLERRTLFSPRDRGHRGQLRGRARDQPPPNASPFTLYLVHATTAPQRSRTNGPNDLTGCHGSSGTKGVGFAPPWDFGLRLPAALPGGEGPPWCIGRRNARGLFRSCIWLSGGERKAPLGSLCVRFGDGGIRGALSLVSLNGVASESWTLFLASAYCDEAFGSSWKARGGFELGESILRRRIRWTDFGGSLMFDQVMEGVAQLRGIGCNPRC